MGKTTIEWATDVWNPTTGCTKVGPGCLNCYAETIDRRFHRDGPFVPWTVKAQREAGQPAVMLHPDRLDQPLRWKKPRRIFVDSMSDLFHEDVPDDFIAKVFAIMAACPWHIFQLLTKRHHRMLAFIAGKAPNWSKADVDWLWNCAGLWLPQGVSEAWPLPNVWLGVSVENQRWADERIPLLLETPAAVRFLSCEPLLGPVDLSPYLKPPEPCPECGHSLWDDSFLAGWKCGGCGRPEPYIHWVIAGGESGPKARPCHPDWVRSLRDQCQAARVSFFFKQWGGWTPGENVERISGIVQTAHWFDEQWMYGREDLANEEELWEDQPDLYRVGKSAAGALLDGREWREFPEVRP